MAESIFESQFASGGMLGFAPRYPSYANYKSETAGFIEHSSLPNPFTNQRLAIAAQPAARPLPESQNDQAVTRKPEVASTPGYYAQMGYQRVTDIGVRQPVETEANRRQTIGGGPLDGLIAEFRSNSLGDDLRKLKEAHQEIIQELKSAMFSKKSKKKTAGKSPARKPANGPTDKNPVVPMGSQQLHPPLNKQRPPALDNHRTNHAAHRKIEPQAERPIDRAHKQQPTHNKMGLQPARRPFVDDEDYRVKTSTVLEARTYKYGDEAVERHPYHSPQLPSRKQALTHRHEAAKGQQLREQFEEDGLGTLHPKVIDEILALREIKISLMKQLNQETSNYNRVILENRLILKENHQLKEQVSIQNVENVPVVQKLTQENQRLKERLARLERELYKATGKYYTDSGKDGNEATSLTTFESEQEENGGRRLNYERMQAELKQYRELYGELSHVQQPTSPKHRRAGKW